MTTMHTPSRTAIRPILLLLGLFCTPAFAQQGVPIGEPRGQWFTSSGAVCNGCKLYAFAAGTSTPQDTYTDANLTTPNANPVILDSAGRATVFVSDRAYKFRLDTSANVTLWTVDSVVGRAPPANVLSKTTTYQVLVTDGKDVLVQADASGGAFVVTLYTAVGNAGRVISVTKTDSSANVVTVDGAGSETINGQTTTALSRQYDTTRLMSNGVGWIVLSSRAAPIAFPATQVASTDVNTLDDYEEGTWTPTIVGSGGQSGQAYSVQQGQYIKIGKMVHVSGRVTLSTLGTITSNAGIGGLPFTAASVTYDTSGTIYFGALTATLTSVTGLIPAATTRIELFGLAAADTVMSALGQASLSATSDFIFSATYMASQ